MKVECLILVFVLLVSGVAIKGVRSLGFSPIGVNNPYVREAANFAVREHNKQSGEKLKLKKVIVADNEPLDGNNGIMYRLTLETTHGSYNHYQTFVLIKPWLPSHKLKLQSFYPVHA
ncbi:uncharacterized protein LOC109807423 [Cajanus cajan]|uniref:Cysteine proteinase inhibitor 5 n=1 Tax=Cajanus cajan TaxID=3821 RepID=A0A151SU85_CAJCA|nr:uncharacterized protein LOC109807423 [Cajanus cajan]KYP58302.1 Cysteine proteinase inhibitor 5 [Cajanus cajan]